MDRLLQVISDLYCINIFERGTEFNTVVKIFIVTERSLDNKHVFTSRTASLFKLFLELFPRNPEVNVLDLMYNSRHEWQKHWVLRDKMGVLLRVLKIIHFKSTVSLFALFKSEKSEVFINYNFQVQLMPMKLAIFL